MATYRAKIKSLTTNCDECSDVDCKLMTIEMTGNLIG